MVKKTMFQKVPEWLKQENEQRQWPYKRNLEDEAFLRAFNNDLKGIEAEFPCPDEEPHPLMLFYGLPRCGKTFFSQVMRHCFDIEVVDNLVARFWDAPCVGARLSKVLNVKSVQTSFNSNYGKTGSLGDPHDFAYFWQKWLKIDSWPYDPRSSRASIDWRQLGEQLRRLSAEWNKPGLMKGVLPSYHIAQFHKAYKNTQFIFLERDLLDVSYSLLRGRHENYGDFNRIYGQVSDPEAYSRYSSMTPYDSIACQLKDLLKMYREQEKQCLTGEITTINYRNLCDSPNEVAEKLAEVLKDNFDYDLPIRQSMHMNNVKLSTHDLNKEHVRELATALEKQGLPLYGPYRN